MIYALQENKAGWLDSRAYDLTLIIGVLALALGAGAFSVAFFQFQYVILASALWFLSYHHVIAAFVKMAGTREDRRNNRFLIYYLPPITLAAVFFLAYFIGPWAVVTIYFHWQWYHYTRQSYGIASFYRRQIPEGGQETHSLFLATLWAVPIWGILHRSAQMDTDFFGQELVLLPVPDVALTVAAIAAISLVMFWMVRTAYDLLRGKMAIGYALFMLSHHIIFYVSYVLIDNPTIGWITVMIWHNAQYMLFVWRDNHKRTSYSKEPSVLKWLSERKPVRVMIYFSLTMLATALFYKSWHMAPMALNHIVPNLEIGVLYFLVVNQSINFHHYMIDSVMWRRRKAKGEPQSELQHI